METIALCILIPLWLWAIWAMITGKSGKVINGYRVHEIGTILDVILEGKARSVVVSGYVHSIQGIESVSYELTENGSFLTLIRDEDLEKACI